MTNTKLKPQHSSAEIQAAVKRLAKEITASYVKSKPPKPIVAIAVLKGAFIFAADLVREIDLPMQLEFVRISSYGTQKVSSGKIEAPMLLLPDLNNRDLLIIEDIVDSGRTVQFLREYLSTQYNPRSLQVVSLLSKPARREVDVTVEHIGFEVGDHFLVGYGLDNAEEYRHLPYLAISSED